MTHFTKSKMGGLCLLLLTFMVLPGCSHRTQQDDHQSPYAGGESKTYRGIIISSRNTTFKGNDSVRQPAIEYTVECEHGNTTTVTQSSKPRYETGQPVFVIQSWRGQSRVIPDQSRGYSAPLDRK